jgi:hypothetical protein
MVAGIDTLVLRSKHNDGPFRSKKQFIEEALKGALDQYRQRAVEGSLNWWKA